MSQILIDSEDLDLYANEKIKEFVKRLQKEVA